jgi:hypothetical protein
MDVVRRDLKRGEFIKSLYEEWKVNTFDVEGGADSFKYLVSEISITFNSDFSMFEITEQKALDLTWEVFKEELLEFIKRNKTVNPEKVSERAALALLDIASNDLILAGIEYVLVEKMKKSLFSRKFESWISPYFKSFTKEVMNILGSYDLNKSGEIPASSLYQVLESCLSLFGVKMNDKDVFLFQRMIENRYKKSKPELDKAFKTIQISFLECINLIEEWASKESFKRLSIKSQIEKTIQEFSTLRSTLPENTSLLHPIDDLIQKLQNLPTKIEKKTEPKLEDLQIRGLKEIFDFYSKQVKQVGQNPTFSELNEHQSVLNLSKFTKFCTDFELLSTFKEKYKIQLNQLSNIFLKSTKCKRVMTFPDFLSSIENLAEAFYTEQYDLFFNEKLSLLSGEEKRKRLLMFLKCENPSNYSLRLKGFGLAFSLEKKDFRIPDYDLSKKYRFRDRAKVKEKIENWKMQRKEASVPPPRSNSVPSHARLKAIQQSLLARPDRVTWDLLNKNMNLITKDELEKLLDQDDIRELIKGGVKIM